MPHPGFIIVYNLGNNVTPDAEKSEISLKKIRIRPGRTAIVVSLVAEICMLIFGAVFLYEVHAEQTTPLAVYVFFALWFLVVSALIVFSVRILLVKSQSPEMIVDNEDEHK
mgnify:CR=1 FL=1